MTEQFKLPASGFYQKLKKDSFWLKVWKQANVPEICDSHELWKEKKHAQAM